MTSEERDALKNRARNLVAADIATNGVPLNAPYVLNSTDGTRYKVRVAKVNNADGSERVIGGKPVYRFYIERPVEVVSTDIL